MNTFPWGTWWLVRASGINSGGSQVCAGRATRISPVQYLSDPFNCCPTLHWFRAHRTCTNNQSTPSQLQSNSPQIQMLWHQASNSSFSSQLQWSSVASPRHWWLTGMIPFHQVPIQMPDHRPTLSCYLPRPTCYFSLWNHHMLCEEKLFSVCKPHAIEIFNDQNIGQKSHRYPTRWFILPQWTLKYFYSHI